MTLRVVNPIDVTEAVLTASDIPEPDASVGEVEWRDPSVLGRFGTYANVREAIVAAADGFLYAFGWGGVTKINAADNTTLEFGSYSGRIYSAVMALDENIYAVGNSGDVVKLDVSTQTLSVIGTFSGTCNSITLANDGNIYGASTNGFAIKISVATQSVSTIGSLGTLSYSVSSLGGDGNVYCARQNNILKIDVGDQSISQFGSYSGIYEGGTTGEDGNIYFVGNTGNVLKLDVGDQSLSTFGAYSGEYSAAKLDQDGIIKCVGYKKANGTAKILDINTNTKTVSQYGSYNFDALAIARAGNGDMYAAGRQANTTDGLILIPQPYYAGDEVVLSTEHLKYQCLSYTYSNPKVGATEDASATWIVTGPTNKWAMLDGLQNTKTSNADDFSVTLSPPSYVNTLAILGFSGVLSINVEVKNSLGDVIYDKDFSAPDFSAIYDHYTYVFYQVASLDKLIVTDIPPLPGVQIKVTFKGSNISIGELIHGFAVNIGDLVTNSTKSDRFRYREQQYNDFGYPVGAPPIVVELNTYDVLVPKLNNPAIQKLLDGITGKNTLWLGDIGGGQELITYGFFERSPIPFTMPNNINYQITVRASV